jgi:hypothetical protein
MLSLAAAVVTANGKVKNQKPLKTKKSCPLGQPQ